MSPDCVGNQVLELGDIHAPMLVICAADDFLTPAYFSRDLAERIANTELNILPRGGHCVSQTMPESFNEAVLDFLETGSSRNLSSNPPAGLYRTSTGRVAGA
jgi:aminoacrylate hydrolase